MKPAPRRPRFRLPLHIHISTLFFLLVLGAGSAIGWVSYQRSVAMLERAAEDLVRRVAEQTLAETDKLPQPVGTAVRLTEVQPGLTRGTEFSEVRYKGDRERAAAPYAGAEVLEPEDIGMRALGGHPPAAHERQHDPGHAVCQAPTRLATFRPEKK